MDNTIFNQVNIGNNRDFTFLDFKPVRGGGRRLSGEHDYFVSASRHIKHGQNGKSRSYRVAFSQAVSEIVYLKGLTHFRIRRDNITSECLFIFLKDTTGMCGKIGWEGKSTKVVRMYNKELVNFFAVLGNLTGDFDPNYWVLSDDVSNSDDYASFRILKKVD